MRLFTAFTPPEPVIAEWARIQEALRAQIVARRFEPLDNAHVTLHFLGEVPEARLETLDACLAEAVQAHAPFEVSLGALAGFPNVRHPRVIFIGLESPEQALLRLQAAVGTALQRAELYQPEARAYVPHLTLLREPQETALAAERMRELTVAPLGWRVEAFDLVRSVTTPQGAIYTSLARYPLPTIARTTL